MTSPVSQTRRATSYVVPVVVVHRHMEVSGVLGSVVITMANKGSFPVIMEISVGDGDPFRCVGDIDQAIIVVFIVGQVRVKLVVINPDVFRCLNSDPVTVRSERVLADEIADDYVALLPDEKTDAHEFWRFVNECGFVILDLTYGLLAPDFPIKLLLEPTLTCCAPVIVPEITMTRATVSSATAAVNCASVDTVVVAPPFPPDVLSHISKLQLI